MEFPQSEFEVHENPAFGAGLEKHVVGPARMLLRQ
jgi:hypothetical protein